MNDALDSLSRRFLVLVANRVLVRPLVLQTTGAPSDGCLERFLESLRFGRSVTNPVQRPDAMHSTPPECRKHFVPQSLSVSCGRRLRVADPVAFDR